MIPRHCQLSSVRFTEFILVRATNLSILMINGNFCPVKLVHRKVVKSGFTSSLNNTCLLPNQWFDRTKQRTHDKDDSRLLAYGYA